MPEHTIAIDAMGGDFAPAAPVEGAVIAAREGGAAIILAGDEAAVSAELAKHDAGGLPISVAPADAVISETEPPALALRSKPRASIAVAVGLARAGKAQAAVSMGSTGATMAASALALGLFPGLERPTLGGPFIGLAPETTIIDLGANVDCKPSHTTTSAFPSNISCPSTFPTKLRPLDWKSGNASFTCRLPLPSSDPTLSSPTRGDSLPR